MLQFIQRNIDIKITIDLYQFILLLFAYILKYCKIFSNCVNKTLDLLRQTPNMVEFMRVVLLCTLNVIKKLASFLCIVSQCNTCPYDF